MQVNDALIDSLADLACLEFSAEEKEGIKKDLEKMISFVEKLNEIDTSGVEPLLYMGNDINVLREDKVEDEMERKEAMANAPVSDGLYFKVPKVIKNPGSKESQV
jgi:aspartyl-tRNA(Asn)/glutamyl-tRNA(Gln) amidotransferase subunit C